MPVSHDVMLFGNTRNQDMRNSMAGKRERLSVNAHVWSSCTEPSTRLLGMGAK